jgi:membrane protease YdiL (CAAX protease family)
VSQPDAMAPAAQAAVAFEIALLLCGLVLAWRKVLSARARAGRVARLQEWRLPPVDFACYLSFGFLGALVLSGAAGLVSRRVMMSADAATIVGSAVLDGGFLLGIAGFYLVFGSRARGDGGSGLPTALTSGLATFLVAMPLVAAVGFAWDLFLTRAGLPDEKQEMVGLLENLHSAPLRWLFVALAAILVPAAEELLFRAGLFRYFRTRAPRWMSIGLTSALFGALHVSWGGHVTGLPSLLPVTALAVVFCLAYERTGMIGTTIVAHSLFNLNSMLLMLAGLDT